MRTTGKSRWPVKMDRYGITALEMRELQAYTLRYWEAKAEADALLTLRISTPPPVTVKDRIVDRGGIRTVERGVFLPRGKGAAGDPVAAAAMKRERLIRRVQIIDRAVALACAGEKAMQKPLLYVVTGRAGVRELHHAGKLYCGVNQFYNLRRDYYAALKGILEEDET